MRLILTVLALASFSLPLVQKANASQDFTNLHCSSKSNSATLWITPKSSIFSNSKHGRQVEDLYIPGENPVTINYEDGYEINLIDNKAVVTYKSGLELVLNCKNTN